MVASIGAVASPAQGVTYYERDGYYARDDPAHRDASAWAGKGAEALGLSGPVDPDTFKAVLEGKVPDGTGRQLGRKDRDGNIHHRLGRDVTLSAPKSVSLAALVGGDGRVVAAHDRAVTRTLAWIENNAVETRMKDPETGRMVHAGDQGMVAATFRHNTSRNLDPQQHPDGCRRQVSRHYPRLVQGRLHRCRQAIPGGAGYPCERAILFQGLTSRLHP